MEKIITPNQGAFIEGMWIAENTVIAQEVINKVKKHWGKNGMMVIKVDLKKAYDWVEWNILDCALGAWGFSLDVYKLIGSCVSTINYSLLLNGGISRTFTPGRGLRQGDHLSSYLFILCSEFLTRLINREESLDSIHGIKVYKNAPTISHLMYADDLLLMSRASRVEAQSFKTCFDLYCGWLDRRLMKRNLVYSFLRIP